MLKSLVRKAFHSVGLEITKVKNGKPIPKTDYNEVMPDVAGDPGLQHLIKSKINGVVMLGSAEETDVYASFLTGIVKPWKWDPSVVILEDMPILICSIPVTGEHWRVIEELKKRYRSRLFTVMEVVLPFTPFTFSRKFLNYFSELKDLAPFYLGETYFGPFADLNKLYPLQGKKVIEFGPFDGSQTAGLVNSGVKELTCIEARAENYLKTLIAKEVFGWKNVNLIMDDMHNADGIKYGRFDLAFCHGTYYHSIAPFVLLENLVSLSDNIFLGGFVTKENINYETLIYDNVAYRVQSYSEDTGGFAAGINKTSYFFHPTDLMDFFIKKGYKTTVISEEETGELASGRFMRFFASK